MDRPPAQPVPEPDDILWYQKWRKDWEEWFVDRAFRRAGLNLSADSPRTDKDWADLREGMGWIYDGGGGLRLDSISEFGNEVHVFLRIDKDIPFHVVFYDDGTWLSCETREV